MKKQRIWPALIVILVMLVLIAAYVTGSYFMIKPAQDKICEGVSIDKIDVSGMTKEQAEQAVSEFEKTLSERILEVDVNGKKVSASLKTIDYKIVQNDYVEQALQIGKDGNIFSNYAKIKDVKKNNVVFNTDFTYSQKKIKKFVKNTCGKECVSAKNAKIKRKNGAFVYTDATEGVTIDTKATIDNINQALKEQDNAQTVTASAIVVIQEPTVTKEKASRCKDKIGSFSTEFNSGNVSRSKNLENAARLINGKVVYPGETFSVHDAISPLTEENGYYPAPSYSNGQVVDSLGGGVCQVSTTLYNAILRAELEIIERSPHSMVVSYVKPSMDAAIAGDYKDFKFRNNTDIPLYIQGGTYSGTIYFNIYGEETRNADRKIEFLSEVTETIQPGADKITYDKTKPVSFTQVTQEAHTGYKAVLWKIVTEDGKSEKTQINSSTYKAEPKYVTVGSAKEKPKATASAAPKATKTPKDKKSQENEKKVQATPVPTQSATENPKPNTDEDNAQ